MITKICLDKVASYKCHNALETDKKVNLIYGLNGTGKSTISNFLYDIKNSLFKHCSIEGLADNELIVYNQKFIQENFYESENLNGIFTLSKENKDAEQKINNAQKEITKIKLNVKLKLKEIQQANDNLDAIKNNAKSKVWEIKTNYTGGDRVLEFCMDGYKSDGSKLLHHILSIRKPETKPTRSIDQLKEEVASITGENTKIISTLPSIKFSADDIEKSSLFEKQIVGNKNSTVAEFITKLGNSDWVKLGLNYIPDEIDIEKETCPFCQEKTISQNFIENVKDYFDESYEQDLNQLNSYLVDYEKAVQLIPDQEYFQFNPKLSVFKTDFELKFSNLKKILSNNLKLIAEKIKSPSISLSLKSSRDAIEALESIITDVNLLTVDHNNKINNRDKALAEAKNDFWKIMRWNYDQTLSIYLSNKELTENNIRAINTSLRKLELEINAQEEVIVGQQKKTINIDQAISKINNGLLYLGIEDFKITKHSDNFYKIARGDNNTGIFQTLSEGEKMIISFLYFIELCRGKKSVDEAGSTKIIVIDDPISSLSHIYVFNVGRVIQNEFLRNNKYEQIFVLTHSLYFFYELTDTNRERRKENQKLFRLRKNCKGSEIIEMSYEEIQNDYHSYWSIIKDDKQPPALIANCMRNIIEYFFNFVEKKDLNKVFQKPSMQDPRFQAFNRYINRESHSLGQNIFDIKEFNYDDFKDAFALFFKENNYEQHYNKMMN